MFNTFEKNIQQYASKALRVYLNPSGFYNKEAIQKIKSIGTKTFTAGLFFSKVNYVNINVK